ncbi:MAG: hypothetical protein ACKOBW_12835 [Planctomycetota bacterium]
MARQEEPREDLLREATALHERIELRRTGDSSSLVIGFRRDGGGSLYVGADYVLQFTSAGEVRRAFFQGQMLKAEAGRLVALDRQRSAARGVELVRDEWSVERQQQWLLQAQAQLDEFLQQLQAHVFITVGQVPAEADVRGRVIGWLQGLPRPLQVAARPHAQVKH